MDEAALRDWALERADLSTEVERLAGRRAIDAYRLALRLTQADRPAKHGGEASPRPNDRPIGD